MIRYLLLCALTLPLAGPLAAQSLLFSTRVDVTSVQPNVADEEILVLDPQGGSRVVLPREALNVMVGDGNGNGLLDDAPVDIDACHVIGPHGGTDWLLSTTVNMSVPGGPSVRDGDVFLWNGTGVLDVQFPESFFTAITGTSGVDVDAFSMDSTGALYFSFAEDETTTEPGLIAENGGNPIIDEQVVLRFDPQDTFAHIHFTQVQVAGIFSQALGGNFTTVVDTTGLAQDPAGIPGDLLLTSASTSQALRGRVVTSRAGGLPFSVGGVPVDPTLIGLDPTTSLDALSIALDPIHPVLRALPAAASTTTVGMASLVVSGLQVGEVVQLVAAPPQLPGPAAISALATQGFGAIYPDPNQPLFHISFQVAAWTLVADMSGQAAYNFTFQGLLPGTQAVVQAVRFGDFIVTNPVSVVVLP